ncbi:hypothetical protein P9112_014378 [Eukaryota sp. TZLM1-RC]
MSTDSDLSDLDDFVDAIEDDKPVPYVPTGEHVNVSTHQRMNECDFSNLIQRQIIEVTQNPIWSLKFGPDPQNPLLLACAGGDNNIHIFKVLSSEPCFHFNPSEYNSKVLSPQPILVLQGHARPVISLCWRPDGLLLSASADKTARLWYIPPDDPLSAPPRPTAILDHKEVVTSVILPNLPPTTTTEGQVSSFPDYAITGSLDQNVYIWNCSDPSKPIAFVHLKAMVTAMDWIPPRRLSPSSSGEGGSGGGTLVVGTHHAWCYVFDFVINPRVSLSQVYLFQAVSQRGSNSKGHKVTSICVRPEINRMLISTNDSRIRSFVFSTCKKSIKYIGHVSKNSHMGASFSPNCKYVLCGSENKKVFIWPIESNYVPAINPKLNIFNKNTHNKSYELIHLADSVTSAVFAPSSIGHIVPPDYEVGSGNENRFIIVATEDGFLFVFENLAQPRDFQSPQ